MTGARVAAARTMRAHGLSVQVPSGWDGSITRGEGDPSELDADDVGVLGTSNPVLHVASFPLPAVRGDYGGGAVERMRATDVFLALVEFDPQAGATPLFSADHLQRPLRSAMFDRSTMHRPLVGATGHQQFFHTHGRAFALYVALGAHRMRSTLVPRADRVLSTLRISTR
ncbi:MAG: hypothetical protein JST64_02840 [Actinobacteria bacterium]|nr:hypothetical protein [Actinomycetota bacterium]